MRNRQATVPSGPIVPAFLENDWLLETDWDTIDTIAMIDEFRPFVTDELDRSFLSGPWPIR